MNHLLSRLLIATLVYCTAPLSSAEPASSLRPELLLTNVSSREHINLSGDWVYSKDLYRTGLTDING